MDTKWPTKVVDRAASAPSTNRRGKESRQRLLVAARKLFVEKGYHQTRPQDISKAADVGHGTFYLHFKDKKACFLAFVDQAGNELEDEIAVHIEGVDTLDGFIRAMLAAVYAYGDKQPGVLSAAMADLGVIAADAAPEDTLIDRWGESWRDFLSPLAEQGVIAKDYDFQLIGHGIVGMLSYATRYAGLEGVDRESAIDNITHFLVRGLGGAIDGKKD